MNQARVKISQVIENQLPSFVRDEFPLAVEFFEEYYRSVEYPGASYDLIQNIDYYIKLDNNTNLVTSTKTSEFVGISSDSISVDSTHGFPDKYGLIQIDSEIITYKSKDNAHFYDCVRGFCGIEDLKNKNNPEDLLFVDTESDEHEVGATVSNLSILFLQEFLRKLKIQFAPGFEDRELYDGVNENVFVKSSNSFYRSKGTEDSFKILFGALYGKDVSMIRPRDYLIQPSDAEYRITRDLVVEALEGNPNDLLNRTLFQDQIGIIPKATGSVTNVQKIERAGKTYYILSLDYDFDKDINVSGSIFGTFTIHPKTFITSDVLTTDTTINVDSTVGFPNSGTLKTIVEGNELQITYESKSLTQFYGCSGIDINIPAGLELALDVFAYAYANKEKTEFIRVRVTGVLGTFNLVDDAYNFLPGDTAEIVSLGVDERSFKFNNWVFNIPMKYQIESLVAISNGYEITTKDNNNIFTGDSVAINYVSSNSAQVTSSFIVSSVIIPEKKFRITTNETILSINYVKKNLNKVIGTEYTADVQNVYKDNTDVLYVASSSLPNYSNQPLDIRDKTVIFNHSGGTTDTIILKDSNSNPKDHNFLTGDAVVYYPESETNVLEGLSKGVYFVTKVTDNSLKLSNSRENIFKQIFVTVSGNVTNSKFSALEFVDSELTPKILESQKLIRKISTPENDGYTYPTKPGKVGILVNGVEILNYKSGSAVFYGPIEKIDVTSFGTGYDVINPPTLEIIDSQTINGIVTTFGSGAVGLCEVEGTLNKIDVIDPGFDYLAEPKIVISGGNGTGARAKANLIQVDHFVSFNAEFTSGHVDITNNTLGFSEYHKFRDAEKVYYDSNNQTAVGGLINKKTYYVAVQNAYRVKLHETLDDCLIGVNTVGLTTYGTGNQYISSYEKKNILGSINVISSGQGYKNRKIQVPSSGINTASNTVYAVDHRYNNRDILVYSSAGTPVSGLSTQSSYMVTYVDNNNFKLSPIGIGTSEIDFYYKTNQYVDFINSGIGTHEFNYSPITVNVDGIIGISTLSNINGHATIQPVFRGNVKSIFLTNGGQNYGTPDIIDYDRKPRFRLKSGSGASLTPVVINGRIVKVIILNAGYDYNSPPDLQITSETGKGAILVPVISNNEIVDIKIVSGGFNYVQDKTTITVISAGKDCNLNFNIKSWNINLKERLDISNQVSTIDDGVLTNVALDEFGLQYTHVYSPRKLREIIYCSSNENGQVLYRADLANDTENKLYHSPILGWAYDGNPIYGPYGYETQEGNGKVKRLSSGYELNPSVSNRPNTAFFPSGFFIEDFIYTNKGDLDENNGRFCRTPEFPNGTYAYFTTIDINKQPEFPYIVGNNYKSKPIVFNFDINSNQENIDLQKTGWLRNTNPYNLNNKYSSYEYIFNPNSTKKQLSNVNYSSSGGLEKIQIISGGANYKVNDAVVLNNSGTSGINAYAIVSEIEGKKVTNITSNYFEATDIEFTVAGRSNELIGYCPLPHEFNDADFVTITDSELYPSLQRTYQVGITTTTLVLSDSVANTATTGIVTYFNVYGGLNPIKENDIFSIGQEQIKVLNIDKLNSRLRVNRNYNGTTGTQHNSGKILLEVPRKFTFNTSEEINYNYQINKEFYFDPKETLGFGATVTFSNPGIGITQVFIDQKHLYLPKHELNTGTKVKYNTNGGTAFYVSNQYGTFQLQNNQDLYIAKINSDIIGISTNPIGIGSTGGFVGIGTITNIVSFNDYGAGSIHSLKTVYPNVVTGTASKRDAIVTTSENHELQPGDVVNIECISGITTTIYFKYNDHNRRIIVNQVTFSSGQVLTDRSLINISSHGFINGTKVIYTSNNPSAGLANNNIYYVIVVDENNIQLATSLYNAQLKNPVFVTISSSTGGSIAKINPEISVFKDEIVVFDVSDSSLSFLDGLELAPAFDIKFFLDPNFNKEFVTSSVNTQFTIQKSGKIGNPNAKVTLTISDTTPIALYYKFVPNPTPKNPIIKQEIIIDNENIVSNNKLSIQNSEYTGIYSIINKTNTTFRINTRKKPEKTSYTTGISYKTTSKSAKGTISDIKVKSKGTNYRKLPSIVSVASTVGSGAILSPRSKTIGKVINSNISISDIGFEYSCDLTLNPTAKLPDILKIEPLSSFKSVGITSIGRNYTISPDLVVIDGFTNKVVTDVILQFQPNSSELFIKKNSNGFYNATPRIIPVNNSNGNRITNISYDSITKEVTVYLNNLYEAFEEHPFQVGDKVLIENVRSNGGKGYNSSSYNYALFEITYRSSLIVTPYYVKYSLASYLSGSQSPGVYDFVESYGRMIKESDFPIFNPILQKNIFLQGETVFSSTASGLVENWDANNEYLSVQTKDQFIINDVVKGSTSGSQGLISEVRTTRAQYNVDASSIFRKGWNKQTGFLNNSNQRIHDSDYYQYFSYSLKSEIPYETWNDSVSSLDHTAGFKKFADLLINSKDDTYSGIQTSQDGGAVVGIADLSTVIDVNCYSDFDLVTENILNIDQTPLSDKLIFGSRDLSDYSELVGNRVLIVDDISDQFSNRTALRNYVVIDSYNKRGNNSRKYYAQVKNKTTANKNETIFISVLQDESTVFLNQYAKLETQTSTGFFDANITGDTVNLFFYPANTIDSYDISYVMYDINEVITGIGTTTFGDINTFTCGITTVDPYLTKTVIKFPTENRSCKALIQFETDNKYQFIELLIVHDGTEVKTVEYGKLSYLPSIGDYSSYISGGNVYVDFTSVITTPIQINTSLILTSNTTKTATGSKSINNSIHASKLISISSSATPGITTVSTYDSKVYTSSYSIITIEDTTNNEQQISEVVLINDNNDAYVFEFGVLPTDDKLGDFSADKVGDNIELHFTPIPNINCQLRIFDSTVKQIDITNPIYSIDI